MTSLCLWQSVSGHLCVSVFVCSPTVQFQSFTRLCWGGLACWLYRMGSKSFTVLFEALLLPLSSTSTQPPFLHFLPSLPHLHLYPTSATSGHTGALSNALWVREEKEGVRNLTPPELWHPQSYSLLLIGAKTDIHIHHLTHCREKTEGEIKLEEEGREAFSVSLFLSDSHYVNVCHRVRFSQLKNITSTIICPFITFSPHSLSVLCCRLAVSHDILMLCCLSFTAHLGL